MADIGFYHLTRSSPEEALGPLLDRTLRGGSRALVLCRDAARVDAVDQALWRMAEPVWLPHGTARNGDAALQPVWIADAAAGPVAPNGATFLFLLDGVAVDEPHGFSRVFDLFDGTDEAQLAAARLRWTAATTAGHVPAYWRQEPRNWIRAR